MVLTTYFWIPALVIAILAFSRFSCLLACLCLKGPDAFTKPPPNDGYVRFMGAAVLIYLWVVVIGALIELWFFSAA